MLDFLLIKQRTNRGRESDIIEVYPDFRVGRSSDLMIRGGGFYAMWDNAIGLWTIDEYDAQRIIDHHLYEYAEELKKNTTVKIVVKYMSNFENKSWVNFKAFLSKLSDQSEQLDDKIVFSNTVVTKKDNASKKLEYPIEPGITPSFDKLFNTLYSEEELTKIMWAIGSIVAGDSKKIQKFFVFFGSPGTGKSTVLNLLQSMFPEYYTTFEAQALTSGVSGFSTEVFRRNPLIGINHEGDLSRATDNSILSSIVGHDELTMNVKYQSSYSMRINTMLFIATNKPVHITDARSGIIRRLIDIQPTGKKLHPTRYDELVSQLEFELGAIAIRCLELYKDLGIHYYNTYRPLDMMLRTNVFFNFVDEYYLEFAKVDFISLIRAWQYYKEYCEEANITYRLKKHVFRDEFKPYWKNFDDQRRIGDEKLRSVYSGFNKEMFDVQTNAKQSPENKTPDWLLLIERESVLDTELQDCLAQYTSDKGTPKKSWDNVKSKLSKIDSKTLHYVIPPSNMITIDFDLKDSNGDKSLALNLEAARKWPTTYAEVSKGGSGLHLHYWYESDPTKLSRIYDENIEVLVPSGKFSIRRKLSSCNNMPIVAIKSGLPLKGDTMVSEKTIQSERSLRLLIMRCLNKEIHAGTKPNVDFIVKLLNDANDKGMVYDVLNLKPLVVDFASKSTNQAREAIAQALSAPFVSEKLEEENKEPVYIEKLDSRLTFFDVEVFPNLFLICWKYEGVDNKVVRMINPKPEEVGLLFKHNLVGFNNRRYDNHILYARFLGYTNTELYQLSSRIVSNDRTALMREAYKLSHTDVYDYASKKQSLKKWQIELGIFHKEMSLAWDKPAPENMWDVISEYCDNDVISLEHTHRACAGDYKARLILSELSGLSPNDSTQSHTERIVFGTNKNPQKDFNYVDLSIMFPGYEFNMGVSTYKGEVVGEGGYVYAEPGIYEDVAYLDVTSMHPRSIEIMNMFGKYTTNYSEIKRARIAIKNGDYEDVSKMFNGRLTKYLGDVNETKALSYALKIVINIVYGLTCARFPNSFKDPRNIDNIVAKRGALFMIDLKEVLKERGTKAVHIKTDSVKIADHTEEDIEFVMEFGTKYGYNFEIEEVFEKLALINDAVLVAKTTGGKWESVGARFNDPYVFKTLFTKEPIVFSDMCEARAVQKGTMYLVSGEPDNPIKTFIGKVGRFCPIKKGEGGGTLLRINEEKEYAVTGTKGVEWWPSEMVSELGREDKIDRTYFDKKVDEAVAKIGEFGDITGFLD